jgi:hypothetical protein
MKHYIAIAKRDWKANSGETFWFPGPVSALLFTSAMTLWLKYESDYDVKAWYFLGMTLACAYRMLNDLQLSYGHSLGFLAPNYKRYQFNYSSFLLFASCIITTAVFSDSILEFFVSFSLLWLLLSFMFFFVRKFYWIVLYVALMATYFVAVSASIKLDKIEELSAFLPSTYAVVWSVLSVPIIGFAVGVSCYALSFRHFISARRQYLASKEYDATLQPRQWKKHPKTSTINSWRLIFKPVFQSKLWDKLEHKLLFGIEIGRVDNILYQALFGANVYSGILGLIIVMMTIIFMPYLIFASIGFSNIELFMPISIAMMFYMVVILNIISMEWVTNRRVITDLFFGERIGRVGLMGCLIYLAVIILTLSTGHLMLTIIVALGTTLMGVLLQTAFVFWVTAKVANVGWLRYISYVYTTTNLAGLAALMYWSIHRETYWPIALTAVGVTVLCYSSLKQWCALDRELYQST